MEEVTLMAIDPQIIAEIGALSEEMDRAGLFRKAAPGPLPTRKNMVPYPSSWRRHEGGTLFMVRTPTAKYLITIDLALPFQGERTAAAGRQVGVYPLSAENAGVLREHLPFTRPAKLPKGIPSFGCGDRLGLANPGHLRVLRSFRVAPVLAQQSIRELALTGRTFGQVIDAGSWAVLQEGYEDGLAADGDHLKTLDEVKLALAAGVTMITLDLSLLLGKEGSAPCPGELSALAGRVFSLGGTEMRVTAADIKEFWRAYWAALPFVAEADRLCREARGAGRYDLEVSVDETPHTTRPVDHLLVALELRRLGIAPFSVAPRFPGEFQKGIDYRGDLSRFEAEYRIHAAIAKHFDYKISIHSGSDKFAVFPIVARLSDGNFHEKTAGTSWLEAVRVAAAKSPDLFRRIYARAGEFFPEAKKYYHIATELTDIAPLDQMPEARLPELLNQEAPRQFLHITYGQILQAPDLGPDLFRLLHAEEEAYYEVLGTHFRHHADDLGLKRK